MGAIPLPQGMRPPNPHPGMNGHPGGPGLMRPHMPQPPQGPQPPMRTPPPAGPMRRRPESEYMDADEIETILRIQWKSLHNGPAYVEDYYYQARAFRSSILWS